ncbi:sensor histidine kinase, partial [Streptomyces sp. SID8455]|nr:sensor histidine kinase [Streptomyces sp. SID8455]
EPSGSAAPRDDERPQDLMALLGRYADARVTLSGPGTPVELAPHAARETAAAVGAALDNVRTHAGPGARAWVLVEDEPDRVLVSVRDEGPGIAEGRLTEAAEEGRLGVAQSIRGRLRDLGGTAELVSVPGQGTEVELTVPKQDEDGREAATGRRDPAQAGEGTQ